MKPTLILLAALLLAPLAALHAVDVSVGPDSFFSFAWGRVPRTMHTIMSTRSSNAESMLNI